MVACYLSVAEKLLNSEGRELRRALFSLKQIFQDYHIVKDKFEHSKSDVLTQEVPNIHPSNSSFQRDLIVSIISLASYEINYNAPSFIEMVPHRTRSAPRSKDSSSEIANVQFRFLILANLIREFDGRSASTARRSFGLKHGQEQLGPDKFTERSSLVLFRWLFRFGILVLEHSAVSMTDHGLGD
ncbi:hypothetical protein WN48_05563 [Eufriesea mexicana]|uniref:Uncharacterized protein n=1 Tax=Eufriesea mexicana TaxID=516756 RepID=A0A310SL65_9HYME|nr:hypothetical protein WN48_05563 [Eufriesea mexicana]